MSFKIIGMEKSEGWRGVFQTIRLMDGIAKNGMIKIRNKAVEIVRDKKGDFNKVKAIFDYLKKNLKYVKDIFGIETLQTIPQTINLRAGDCDDFTIIGSGFLQAVGFPVNYVVAGVYSNFPNHVFLETMTKEGNIYFDLTRNNVNEIHDGIKFKKSIRIRK